MFPIATTKLEDFAPDVQQMLLGIVNKAQPQASPFLLYTLGSTDTDPAVIATIAQSLKLRKPVIVAPNPLQVAMPDAAPEQVQAASYRLIQMLLEKRANIIFDNAGVTVQHLPLLRYATAIGYKVSLCPASAMQPADETFVPACQALGATLYALENDGDELASAEALGQQIARAI